MDWPANDMYYPAMNKTDETPYAGGSQLLSGHAHETSGYRAYRPNGVGDWLLILTLSGEGRFGHPAGELLSRPGDWVLLPAGTAHDYGVARGAPHWELLWAHFRPRPDWHQLLGWPQAGGGLMHLHLDGPEIDQFHTVHALQASGRKRAEALAMNALESLLLRCDEFVAPHSGPLDQRIERAIDFIEAGLAQSLSVGIIADAAGLSPSRFSHLFREQTGQSVQAFLEERRMVRAADLLRRTSFPVQQVAAQLGFDSPFYFSRRFALWSGKSPTAFRRAGA